MAKLRKLGDGTYINLDLVAATFRDTDGNLIVQFTGVPPMRFDLARSGEINELIEAERLIELGDRALPADIERALQNSCDKCGKTVNQEAANCGATWACKCVSTC